MTKPRCQVQSLTPGHATTLEALTYVREGAQAIADRVAMPAQDHGFNCLQTAFYELRRLILAEERCATAGHQWAWSPAVLLTSPPMRRKMCVACGFLKTKPDASRSDHDKIATEDEWTKLGGY